MDANTRGALFIKADRINERIDKFLEVFKNETKGNVTEKDLDAFVKTMHIIVTTELTQKGVNRRWS